MNRLTTKNLALTALCLALGLLLPLLFHAIGSGSVFLPMHIPVLLCGFLCGWQYGAACGLLTPTSGEILVCGQATGSPASHAQVSYLPERMAVPDWMTAKQLVHFYQDFYGDFRQDVAWQMLSDLNIDPALRVREMSKGTREKVQLILVMSRAAMLYLLDEPIGGVDPATRDYILSTIIANYNPEAAVVISTHLIADVEKLLDQVIFLKNGQLVLQSEVDQLREEKGMSVDALFREVFKC